MTTSTAAQPAAAAPPTAATPAQPAPRQAGFAPLWLFPLGGLAHSLFMACIFPPANIWPLTPLALLPLVYVAGKLAWSPGKMRWKLALFLIGAAVAPLWLNRWMLDVAAIGYPFQGIYLGLYPTVFVWALAKWYRTVRGRLPMSIVVPILWTGLEVLKGEFVFGGYGWHLLAHPLIHAPVLAAPAAYLGTYFVSFLVAAWAGIAADLLPGMGRPGSYRLGSSLVVGSATLALWVTAALLRAPAEQAPRTFTVGVVQTNVAQDNKNAWSPAQSLKDFKRFVELTTAVANPGRAAPTPDVIAWPETMFPGMALNPDAIATERRGLAPPPPAPPEPLVWMIDRPAADGGPINLPTTAFHDELVALQARLGTPMLVGGAAIEGLSFSRTAKGGIKPASTARYNSAFLIENGVVRTDRYDKIALTPFGEVIPGAWRFPSFQQWLVGLGAEDMSFDLGFGSTERVFEIAVNPAPASGPAVRPTGGGGGAGGGVPVRVVTPICFEGTVPSLCRRLVWGSATGGATAQVRRADVMLNLSNDGWFGEVLGVREQHLQNARWRCVELGVPMVRAVNTGISCAIDHHGRITTVGLDPPSKADQLVDGTLTATVALAPRESVTLYCRIGDLFGLSTLALTCMGLLFAVGSATIGRLLNRGQSPT